MAQTIFEAYNGCKKRLMAAGIEDYVFEAKQIIKFVTGFSNAEILSNYTKALSLYQENNIERIIKQRLIHYPLQYILGKWDFYGRSFYVGPGVLCPRADTETVIEVCGEMLKGRENPEILDLCTGTGCIAITLAKENPTAKVIAAEKYDTAMRYAEKNIALNKADNVTAVLGDVFEGVAANGKYDLIVSNPPYVSASEMENLQPEVAFEPDTALYGGEDGLLFYRAIVEKYKNSLKPRGALVFEIGAAQGQAVAEIMQNAGFNDVQIKKDLAENDRVVFGTVNFVE